MTDDPARVAFRRRDPPTGAPDIDALYAVERAGAVVGFVARDTSYGEPRPGWAGPGRPGWWFGYLRSGLPATPACRSRHNAAAYLLTALDGYVQPPLVPGTGALPAEALGDA